VPDPDPIDFTQATPDEIKAWQAKRARAKAAREAAPPYDAWEDLTRDIFYSYHHSREPEVKSPDQVDPAVAHHAKIATHGGRGRARAGAEPHRDDATASAIATMAASRALREALEDELIDQARQSEDFEQARDSAEGAQQTLDDLREGAGAARAGSAGPRDLVDQIKEAVQDKRQAQAQAAQIAQSSPTPIRQAATRRHRGRRAGRARGRENAASIPSFGQGFGAGRAALRVARAGADHRGHVGEQRDPAAVAELYGRLDRDMRFKRAKRVSAARTRSLISSSGMTSDASSRPSWRARGRRLRGRLLHALPRRRAARVRHRGRGARRARSHRPHLRRVVRCRRAQRLGEGAGDVPPQHLPSREAGLRLRRLRFGGQCKTHLFKAKEDLNAQAIVDMASHFFGGGTTPVIGLAAAGPIMSSVPSSGRPTW
jgi:hypothetical protein